MGPHSEALRRTAERYRGCGRFTRHYVASKLHMDPVNRAILALAAAQPFGRVVDVGSGRGQLGVALLEAGLATAVLALDKDVNALGQLRQAAAGLPVRTQRVDLSAWHPAGAADTVLLIDVLYQLATHPQLALLRCAAGAATARVVVRASDPAPGWRSTVSRVLERLGRGWWPTFGARHNALPPALLAETIAACGYTVEITPCRRGTPLAGMLLVGRRVGPCQP